MKSQKWEIRYLSQEDVLNCDVLNLGEAIQRMEKTLSLFERGECIHPPKSVLRWSDDPNVENVRGRINFLSAYVGGEINAVGMKWIASFPLNREKLNVPRATALVVLNDPDCGLPIAIMEGSIISAIRTAAVTGVAFKYLARKDTARVGIIGTGIQSRTQVMALRTVLKGIKEIVVYNRTHERALQFASEMAKTTGLKIKVVDAIENAARDVDLLMVSTTVHTPLMRAEWLKPGMLSVQFAGHECEFDVIKKADKLVCDHWDGLKHRGIMTPAVMYQRGLLKDEDIHADLGEIINGKKKGRERDDELIHFSSVGMGISDVAIGSMVYKTALEKGIGIKLPLWHKPLWV